VNVICVISPSGDTERVVAVIKRSRNKPYSREALYVHGLVAHFVINDRYMYAVNVNVCDLRDSLCVFSNNSFLYKTNNSLKQTCWKRGNVKVEIFLVFEVPFTS